jgi:succinyl-diaminopimelate desuccinylase
VKERILALIAERRDRILDLTRRLVEIPTENPPGRDYRRCVGLLEEELAGIGLQPTVVEVPIGGRRGEASRVDFESYPRYCLLAGYGRGPRILYFHGHYDVVPAASADLFVPRLEGGRLHGRGTADMKSGLAAMIYAVDALAASGVELDGRVDLVIVPDEETGSAGGAGWLASQGVLGRSGAGMLLAEPTGGVVWNANRGALSLRVTARGKPAHGVLPHEGVNAFEGMLAAARELQRLGEEVRLRKTSFRIEPDEARRSILMLGGRCEGGTSYHTVPAECAFTVDRRINPEEDLEEEKGRLFALFDRVRAAGVDLDVELFQEGLAASLEENHPFAHLLGETVREVTGNAPRFELCPGLLETRFYVPMGVPALAYGPGLLSVSHGPEEYVEMERVYECAAVYALMAARLLGRG